MTALERNRRRTDRFRIIKRPRLKQAWPRFSIQSRERPRKQTAAEHAYQHEPMEPPHLDEMTVTAMKVEVESLLFDANGSCTVLDMANAIAGSPQVTTLHAEASVDSTASEGPIKFIGRIFTGLRLGGVPSREKNRQMKRRYDLMKALGQLEARPSSSGTRISTWEEAKEELRSVVTFPIDSLTDIPRIDKIAEEIDDSLTQYKKRLQEINRQRVHDELESLSRWQQVAKVSTLPEIGEDGAGLDAADLLLSKRLAEEYEKRDERLKSKAVQEMDERMKQKERDEEAQKRASSLMQQLSAEDKNRVIQALNEIGPPTEVISQVGLDSIQRESIQRLLPGQWLNDEVIHYFLVMLSKRDEEICREDPSRKRCHFFKSFFMTKLLNEGNTNPDIDGTYEYKNVKRWSKKVPGTCLLFLLMCLVILACANHSHVIPTHCRQRYFQFGEDHLSHQPGKHALGLRRHLHAGKAHPVLRFDGRRRDDVPGSSIPIRKRRTSRQERVTTAGPRPVEVGRVHARHSSPVEWYVVLL
jgi:hypothetical protein